ARVLQPHPLSAASRGRCGHRSALPPPSRDRPMRKTVRPFVLSALLAGLGARGSSAQTGSMSSDTLHAAPANASVGKSNVLPVAEISGFLTLLSVHDRLM